MSNKYETTRYSAVLDSCYSSHFLEVAHNGCERAPISGSNGIYILIRDKANKDKTLGNVVISYDDAVLLAGTLLKMKNSHEVAMLQPNALGESLVSNIANNMFKEYKKASDSMVLAVLKESPNAGLSNYKVDWEPGKSTLRQSIADPIQVQGAMSGRCDGISPAHAAPYTPKPLTDAEAILAMMDGKQVFPWAERNAPDADKHFYFLQGNEVVYRWGAAGVRVNSPVIPSKRGPGSKEKRATSGWMVWQNPEKKTGLSLQEATAAMRLGKVVKCSTSGVRYFLTDETVKGIFTTGDIFNNPSNGPLCVAPEPGLWSVEDRGSSLPPLNSGMQF